MSVFHLQGKTNIELSFTVTDIAVMDPKNRYDVENIGGVSSAAEIVPEGFEPHENETDSLQSLSHLDPPVDSVYMICGVFIALVLVGVIIVLVAVGISKLRKREDHANNEAHPEHPAVMQTTGEHPSIFPTSNMIAPTHEICRGGIDNPVSTCVTKDMNGSFIVTNETAVEKVSWVFPPILREPPAPSPAPQYVMYNDEAALVHDLDRPGFARGIRKNLGGRWRRLVKKNSERVDTYAIPPELKDQLKTIFVY